MPYLMLDLSPAIQTVLADLPDLREIDLPSTEWALKTYADHNPQPWAVWHGGRPGLVGDGYDFQDWAAERGFTASPAYGEWPYITVAVNSDEGMLPASLTYIEGAIYLVVWRSVTDARVGLRVAYPTED